MFPWSRADFRHHVLRLVREYVPRSWRSCTRSSTSAIQTRFGVTSTPAPRGAGLHLIVDSTSLSIVGEGEWAAAKHGGRGRRGWKKLHLGVDRSGVIVARALTEASVDDATTGITLIEATDGALGRVTADAAYETIGFYEAAGARGATVVVPPTRTANVSRYGPRSSARAESDDWAWQANVVPHRSVKELWIGIGAG